MFGSDCALVTPSERINYSCTHAVRLTPSVRHCEFLGREYRRSRPQHVYHSVWGGVRHRSTALAPISFGEGCIITDRFRESP
jgi:hypothetical protein